MLSQHASNLSFHQLLEDLWTEVGVHLREEGRSATEIAAMVQIVAAAHEW